MIKKFALGAAWSFIGTAVGQVLVLASAIVCARSLGVGDYGGLVLAQTTVATVALVAGLGLGGTATRFIPAWRRTRSGHVLFAIRRGQHILIATSAALCVALVAGSDLLAAHLFASGSVRSTLIITALCLPALVLDAYYKSVILGYEQTKAYAVVCVCGGCIQFVALGALSQTHSLSAVAIGYVIGLIGQALVSWQVAVRITTSAGISEPIEIGSNSGFEWNALIAFAAPTLVAAICVTPAHWVVQGIIARTEAGVAQVAIFAVALQWFTVILFVPATAGRVLTPILTDLFVGNDGKQFGRVFVFAVSANAVAATLSSAAIVAAAPLIVKAYGAQFEGLTDALKWAVAAACIAAAGSPLGNMLAAQNRMWGGALLNGVWLTAYVGFAYIYREDGAIGAAKALLLAYCVHTVTMAMYGYHAQHTSKGAPKRAGA